MGQGDCGQDGTALPGRPRPHYTYSRKVTFKRNKGAASGVDLTDNEDDDSSSKAVRWVTGVGSRIFNSHSFHALMCLTCR